MGGRLANVVACRKSNKMYCDSNIKSIWFYRTITIWYHSYLLQH
jgi:hypothetical protein